MVQLSYLYILEKLTTGKTIALTIGTFVDKKKKNDYYLYLKKGKLNTETDTVERQHEGTWGEDGRVFSGVMYLQAKENGIVRKYPKLEETEEGSPLEPSETTQPC